MKAALFLASVYAALFAACAKVRYVEVPAATHHTFWAQAGASDMVSTSDTVIIHEKEAGDTVRQTVYRTRYVTKFRDRYDTVCYVERDTVAYAVPAQQGKEAEGRGWTSGIAIAALALLAAATLYAMKRR